MHAMALHELMPHVTQSQSTVLTNSTAAKRKGAAYRLQRCRTVSTSVFTCMHVSLRPVLLEFPEVSPQPASTTCQPGRRSAVQDSVRGCVWPPLNHLVVVMLRAFIPQAAKPTTTLTQGLPCL